MQPKAYSIFPPKWLLSWSQFSKFVDHQENSDCKVVTRLSHWEFEMLKTLCLCFKKKHHFCQARWFYFQVCFCWKFLSTLNKFLRWKTCLGLCMTISLFLLTSQLKILQRLLSCSRQASVSIMIWFWTPMCHHLSWCNWGSASWVRSNVVLYLTLMIENKK